MPKMTVPIAISGSVLMEYIAQNGTIQPMVKIVLDAPTQGQGFIELPASYFAAALIAQLQAKG